MTLTLLTEAASKQRLDVFGICHTVPNDNLGNGTIVLLGPKEPGFWAFYTGSTEYNDGKDDPMDRWSSRVVANLAMEFGGTAYFPFGTPPLPFFSWATRSARAFSSPVAILVHDVAGLMVSYRGAILLPETLDLPETAPSPCASCKDKPCLTACPVGALTGQGYDLPKCHDFLDSNAGQTCMDQGCAVRRVCPVSQNYARQAEQSAYHMGRFHRRGANS